MYRVLPLGRSRHVRTLLIALALVGLLGAMIPMATSGHLGVAAVPTMAHPSAVSTHAPSAATSRAAAASSAGHATAPTRWSQSTVATTHPADSGTGTFWIANSSFSNESFLHGGCYSYSFTGYFDSSCYKQSVTPSLLNLANGNMGIAYSTYTNVSGTSCSGSATSVTERVVFQISSNGGQTFGPMAYLGNSSSCLYLDAIEPSFAVSSDGTIFGVYVEENYSGNQGNYISRTASSVYCYYCYGPTGTDDALAFTMSTDNGSTFSAPVTIQAGGNISKPQIAVFGDSVYVLYENISNGTSFVTYGQYGYYTAPPISEMLLSSGNNGTTWVGPTILPGQNASNYYDALGGSIAVNATGTVGVAYFTNHSCPGWGPYYTCWDSGDDLVYATSSNNGTSWSPLVTVQKNVGELQYYPEGYYLAGYFQVVPQAALAFNSGGSTAYIAWAGAYNKTALSGVAYYWDYDWTQAGVFAAVGPSSGSGFTVSAVAVVLSTASYDQNFNPSIAVSTGGTIYVAYTTANETYCYGTTCPTLDGRYIEYLTTSTDGGATWTSANTIGYSNTCLYGTCRTGNAYDSFSGFSSSIAFNGAGNPVLAYPLADSYEYTYTYYGGTSYYNYTYATELYTASIWTGATVAVNFTENNVSAGGVWGFSVNGNKFSTTAPWFNLTNVPKGQPVSILAANVAVGWGTESTPVLSVPSTVTFNSDGHVFVNYTLSYLLTLSIEPTNPEFAEIWFYSHTNTYYYYEVFTNCPPCTNTYNYTSSYSWYFLANSTLELNSSWQYGSFSYWTGFGSGSYTGAGGHANITFHAPINETGWLGGFGSYNLSLVPVGLPSTSTFHVSVDGTPYTGSGASPLNVSNVLTGAHQVTDAWASSATAGWEYFGQPSPANPVIVPAETSVDLNFAYVDVAAPVGTVSFQAQGLTAGTVWNFEFNGTIYSSATPWINVSTHPGTFPVHAFTVVSQNTSAGYTPSGVGPSWAVTTGSTYLVTYVSAYKVLVEAGTGGGVTPGTGAYWVAAGASSQFIASAHAGYGFGGWSGSGVGSYTGLSSYANLTVNGPIVQSASFYPLPNSRFNLTFSETGLAPGTWWTVFLGGSGYSSNQTTFLVQDLLACGTSAGNYNLTIPYAYSQDHQTRYVPTSHIPKVVCTNGATVEEEIFASQFLLVIQSTAGGFAQAQIGSSSVTTSVWVASGASVALSAIGQTGYDFLGWNGTGQGNYTGPGLTQGIIMAGPIEELATFALHVNPPPPTFTITFHEQQTLAAGTVWGILFGGTGYSSTSATLAVSGLTAQTYPLTVTPAFSPDGLTRYTTLGNVPSVTVAHNATVLISYTTSYWVSVSGTPGGTTTPGSSWVTSGGSIFLNVTVLDGYTFVGWNGTGAAAYSGPTAGNSLTVSSPIREVATFAPIVQIISTSSGGGSALWTEPTTWIALAAVGLVVGLVVGLLVSRRGGRNPPPATAYQGPSPPEGGNV